MFKVNYGIFARPMLMDADTGVEVPVGTESAADSGTNNEPTGDPGNESPDNTPPNEPVEKAFAARLAKEREKLQAELQAEYSEKYRDYDLYKGIGEYFQQANQYEDPKQLYEEIELARLQERAEQSQIPPEMQRRLEELEAKAAEADKLKQEQELRTWYSNFEKELETFASDKGADAKALEKYMLDNNISNMDIAYRAMAFEDAKAEREKIESEAIKKYLDSKRAPRFEGSGTAGYVPPAAPKTWEQSRANAVERLRSLKQPQ